MATIRISDVSDARLVARHFGFVPSNDGQRGAFPIRQLSSHLAKMGHTLDVSDYVPSSLIKDDPSYLVSTLVKEDGNTITPAYALISLSEVREITGKTGRGRPGFMDIINAAVKREKWQPVSNRKIDFEVKQS